MENVTQGIAFSFYLNVRRERKDIRDVKQYEKISGELFKALGYVDDFFINTANKSIDEIKEAEYILNRIQQDVSLMKLTINRRKKTSKQSRIAK
ncbi:hypothetical protein ACSVDA_20520 [Cytobacillus sp. Hm23]